MVKNQQIQQFSQELMQSISYIQRLARIMLKKRSDVLLQGKVTMPQYLTLELLSNKGALKMNRIAKAFQISLPAATGLINRLVKMKLVKRSYDKNDRRVILIVLTPEGRRVTTQTKIARRKVIEEMFGCLSDQERQTYLNIIRKVKKTLYEKDRDN
jgi:DNA-binding MarR family transcriptional regulator